MIIVVSGSRRLKTVNLKKLLKPMRLLIAFIQKGIIFIWQEKFALGDDVLK